MQSFNYKSSALARLAVQAMTAGALIFSSLALRADDGQANKINGKEAAFIKETARAGRMEVKMGQIGKDQGQSAEIKQLGERIVKDHTKSNEELTAIAANKGVDVASDAAKHPNDGLNKLTGKSGSDFDKAYAEHMIRDHKKDIAKFEKASRECQDAELKAFIDKTLPTLRQHLEQATAAGRSVGLDEKTLSSFDQESDAAGSPAPAETGVSAEPGQIPDAVTERNAPSINDQPAASVNSSVNVDTDKNDGKTLGVKTEKGDGKTLGVTTRKSDHKVLGLSTDKNDGKLLGLLPAPKHHKKQASAEANINTDTSSSTQNRIDSAGAPAEGTTDVDTSTTATTDRRDSKFSATTSRLSYNDVPAAVQTTITSEGGTKDVKNIKKTTENGRVVYKVEFRNQGKNVVLHVAEDGSIVKDNRKETK